MCISTLFGEVILTRIRVLRIYTNSHMSTPAHALVAYGKALFMLMSIFTFSGVLVSRVYIFYQAYSLFSISRVEETWLRAQCKEPAFYSNMRQHTDLCAHVEHNAMQWIILHALNKVFTTSHLCGDRACIEYLNDLVVRGIAWPAAVIICLFVITIPSIITSMASRSIWHASDKRARGQHGENAPFYSLRILPPPSRDQSPWTDQEEEAAPCHDYESDLQGPVRRRKAKNLWSLSNSV